MHFQGYEIMLAQNKRQQLLDDAESFRLQQKTDNYLSMNGMLILIQAILGIR